MRKVRAGMVGVSMAAAMVFAGNAQAYQFSFAQKIPHERQIERAISWQLNREVARHYSINPVSFVRRGGIVIHITSQNQVWQHCGVGADGCHTPNVIWVDWIGWSLIIDHEVIETEVDRYANTYLNGQLLEPCDPVEGQDYFYGRHDVMLADWVYPGYFEQHYGQVDYLRAL